MIEVFELVLLMLVLPAGLAWGFRKYAPIRNGFVGAVAVVISAAVPAMWVFYETQQADGITRAASVVVTPFLFLLMLIPAGVGYVIGKSSKPE